MKLNSEDGSTLLEVLIATLVMSLTGVMILSGFLVARSVSLRNAEKSNVINLLDTAVQELSQRPFTPCVNATPYPKPQQANTEIQVQVFDTAVSNGTWVACDGTGVTGNENIQLVTLSISLKGKKYSQSIMKAKE